MLETLLSVKIKITSSLVLVSDILYTPAVPLTVILTIGYEGLNVVLNFGNIKVKLNPFKYNISGL